MSCPETVVVVVALLSVRGEVKMVLDRAELVAVRDAGAGRGSVAAERARSNRGAEARTDAAAEDVEAQQLIVYGVGG